MRSAFYEESSDLPSDNLFNNLTEVTRIIEETCKQSILYKKGQALFHEGTRPMGVFFVKSGRVKTVKSRVGGKDQLIGIANSNSFLGYKELLNNEQYPCSAYAFEKAEIYFIPKDKFIDIISREPQLFNKVFKVLHQELIAI